MNNCAVNLAATLKPDVGLSSSALSSQVIKLQSRLWRHHISGLNSFDLQSFEYDGCLIPSNQKFILVLHDRGSALFIYWAHHNSRRVADLAFMKFVAPMTWGTLDKGGVASDFQDFRGPPEVGWKLIFEGNVFGENVFREGCEKSDR